MARCSRWFGVVSKKVENSTGSRDAECVSRSCSSRIAGGVPLLFAALLIAAVAGHGVMYEPPTR